LRSGLSEAEIRRIMATQLARAERVAQADDVIDNSGHGSATGAQVDELDRRYRSLARQADAARKPDKS
jgi:dephospho-CoA kinase